MIPRKDYPCKHQTGLQSLDGLHIPHVDFIGSFVVPYCTLLLLLSQVSFTIAFKKSAKQL
jgi:hypothetical protein